MNSSYYASVPSLMDEEYTVGKDGSVWSRKRSCWRRRKVAVNSDGYIHLEVRKSGFSKRIGVHILVLNAFVGPCPKGMECRHLDGDPSNNNLQNLCWGTHEEQYQDRIKHGTDNSGERNGRAVLTEKTVKKMIELAATGKYSKSDLKRMFGIADVWGILQGSYWKHIKRPKNLMSLCKNGRRGENNTAVLTEGKVREIRRLWKERNLSTPTLAKQYDVRCSVIRDVVSNRTWKWVV